MPHYKDGTAAKIGDEVQCLTAYVPVRHGIVTAIYESESCNLSVATIDNKSAPGSGVLVIGASFGTVNAKECEKLAPCVPGAKIEAGK